VQNLNMGKGKKYPGLVEGAHKRSSTGMEGAVVKPKKKQERGQGQQGTKVTSKSALGGGSVRRGFILATQTGRGKGGWQTSLNRRRQVREDGEFFLDETIVSHGVD